MRSKWEWVECEPWDQPCQKSEGVSWIRTWNNIRRTSFQSQLLSVYSIHYEDVTYTQTQFQDKYRRTVFSHMLCHIWTNWLPSRTCVILFEEWLWRILDAAIYRSLVPGTFVPRSTSREFRAKGNPLSNRNPLWPFVREVREILNGYSLRPIMIAPPGTLLRTYSGILPKRHGILAELTLNINIDV